MPPDSEYTVAIVALKGNISMKVFVKIINACQMLYVFVYNKKFDYKVLSSFHCLKLEGMTMCNTNPAQCILKQSDRYLFFVRALKLMLHNTPLKIQKRNCQYQRYKLIILLSAFIFISILKTQEVDRRKMSLEMHEL